MVNKDQSAVCVYLCTSVRVRVRVRVRVLESAASAALFCLIEGAKSVNCRRGEGTGESVNVAREQSRDDTTTAMGHKFIKV